MVKVYQGGSTGLVQQNKSIFQISKEKEFCLLDQYQVEGKEEFYRTVNCFNTKKH